MSAIMMKSTVMQFQDLLQQRLVELIIVHSHSMSLYTLEAQIAGTKYVIMDGTKPKQFRSTQQLRDALTPLKIQKSILAQHCAYDEMIGQRHQQQPTEMPFSLNKSTTKHL